MVKRTTKSEALAAAGLFAKPGQSAAEALLEGLKYLPESAAKRRAIKKAEAMIAEGKARGNRYFTVPLKEKS